MASHVNLIVKEAYEAAIRLEEVFIDAQGRRDFKVRCDGDVRLGKR